jgi:polar amino acid transport system substrate-binding protein
MSPAVGYGSEILAEVVKGLGVRLNQLDLPWQGILPGVLAGNRRPRCRP